MAPASAARLGATPDLPHRTKAIRVNERRPHPVGWGRRSTFLSHFLAWPASAPSTSVSTPGASCTWFSPVSPLAESWGRVGVWPHVGEVGGTDRGKPKRATPVVEVFGVVNGFKAAFSTSDAPLRAVPLGSSFPCPHPVVEVGEIHGVGRTSFDGVPQQGKPLLLQVVWCVLSDQPGGVCAVGSDEIGIWPSMLGDQPAKPRVVVEVDDTACLPLVGGGRDAQCAPCPLVTVGSLA